MIVFLADKKELIQNSIFGLIVFGLICVFACYHIMRAKGYPEYACGRGAGWAYLINIVWVIVTLCRPQAKRGENIPEERDMSFGEFIGWIIAAFVLIGVAIYLMSRGDDFVTVGLAVLFFGFAPAMALIGRI